MASHCCDYMKHILEDEHTTMSFDPKFRVYSIADSDQGSSAVFYMTFCPWCGVKLPTSLRDQWFDLAASMGVEPLADEDWKKKLPPEMLDERWWRARGL